MAYNTLFFTLNYDYGHKVNDLFFIKQINRKLFLYFIRL